MRCTFTAKDTKEREEKAKNTEHRKLRDAVTPSRRERSRSLRFIRLAARLHRVAGRSASRIRAPQRERRRHVRRAHVGAALEVGHRARDTSQRLHGARGQCVRGRGTAHEVE
jgi:hypothetical protein